MAIWPYLVSLGYVFLLGLACYATVQFGANFARFRVILPLYGNSFGDFVALTLDPGRNGWRSFLWYWILRPSIVVFVIVTILWTVIELILLGWVIVAGDALFLAVPNGSEAMLVWAVVFIGSFLLQVGGGFLFAVLVLMRIGASPFSEEPSRYYRLVLVLGPLAVCLPYLIWYFAHGQL